MKRYYAAIWAECLKARKSKVLWGTMIGFAFIAILMGLLILVTNHPELVGGSMIIKAKSAALGKGDWPSYLSLLIEMIIALGVIGFGIVASWVFGREYSDRVAKDLLALPVSRSTIVISKFIVILLWSILLSLILFGVGFVTGLAVNIPGWSGQIARHDFWVFVGSTLLTILLCTPVAFIASFSRGYLLPLSFVIFILILTNLIAIGLPNVLPYFPWAIPMIFSGQAGSKAVPGIGAISYIILGLTSVLGIAATAAWWQFADQK